MTYPAFGKIPRWDREVIITEKIDGTNGLVLVVGPDSAPPSSGRFRVLADGTCVAAGSRTRWIDPEQDNHGFAAWVWGNADELAAKLGPGRHYGEWYGKGIQRGYGLPDKRFMLFNVGRWSDPALRPSCCEVATVLVRTEGSQMSGVLPWALGQLKEFGSKHVPGFMNPEGIIIYHTAGNNLYKVTLGLYKVTLDGHKVERTKPQMDRHPSYGGGDITLCQDSGVTVWNKAAVEAGV